MKYYQYMVLLIACMLTGITYAQTDRQFIRMVINYFTVRILSRLKLNIVKQFLKILIISKHFIILVQLC